MARTVSKSPKNSKKKKGKASTKKATGTKMAPDPKEVEANNPFEGDNLCSWIRVCCKNPCKANSTAIAQGKSSMVPQCIDSMWAVPAGPKKFYCAWCEGGNRNASALTRHMISYCHRYRAGNFILTKKRLPQPLDAEGLSKGLAKCPYYSWIEVLKDKTSEFDHVDKKFLRDMGILNKNDLLVDYSPVFNDPDEASEAESEEEEVPKPKAKKKAAQKAATKKSPRGEESAQETVGVGGWGYSQDVVFIASRSNIDVKRPGETGKRRRNNQDVVSFWECPLCDKMNTETVQCSFCLYKDG